ncbi:MAG: thioredoxin domain-containing protein [Chloroflexi bacterium]|nr:thioredoxin domain-containing protein [Chloroflexota bacterium]
MASFHFSPRPNRAAEIPWWEWGEAAFQRARQEDRPVLLSISAVWCHWCHVMDETSYSDPETIALISSLFVPIRVDTDQRPDVNQRYNMGGWPTTVLLTPQGDILTGGTYIPPQELRRLLLSVSTIYRTHKVDIATAILEQRQRQAAEEQAVTSEEPGLGMVEEMEGLLAREFDHQHGGFGGSPKFPETPALELLLFHYRLTGRALSRSMVTQTLYAMATHGLFDPVAGGFFRYSTTADWTSPHYEKMLEDNVRLLSVYLAAYQLTGEIELRHIASRTADYLLSTLYQPELGAFAGSQDADEEYYRLSPEERARRPAPGIDGTVYVPLNARAAEVLLQASRGMGRTQARKVALGVLDFLWRRCRHPSLGMFHYYAGGQAQVPGLLADQVWMAWALVAAYEETGSERYLERAQRLVEVVIRDYSHPRGGFYDRAVEPEAQGYLAQRLRLLEENAVAAELLHRLYLWTSEARFRELAQGTLRACAGIYQGYGRLAAGYVLAVAHTTVPAVVAKVSRAGGLLGRQLYQACLALDYPNVLVRCLGRRESGDLAPHVLLCLEDRCLPPVTEASQLATALQSMVSS